MYKTSKTFYYSGLVFLFIIFSLFSPANAFATIYQPGETLEPDCAPGSPNCGVAVFNLNGQTNTNQSLVATDNGTDFSIASLLNIHSFNLPSSSSLARGLLTPSDWSLFNSKLSTVSSDNWSGPQLTIQNGGTGTTNGSIFGSGALSFISSGINPLILDSGTTGEINIGVGADSKNINLGTGTGGNILNLGTDDTNPDTINIGSALDTFSITSNGLNVSPTGDLTGVNSIDTILFSPTEINFAAAGRFTSTKDNPVTLDSGTTGPVNVGTGDDSKSINIGTGTAGNSINIGTDDSSPDSITIGSKTDSLAITSSGLNVSPAGDLSGVDSIDTIIHTATAITFAAAGRLTSTTTNAITLDSGTTGPVNVGTGGNQKIVNIGNTTLASRLNLNSGTGGIFLNGAAPVAAGHLVLCIDNASKQIFIGSSASSCDVSSFKYKHDIKNIGLGLDAVNALHPVSFAFNDNDAPTLGFIAEEAAAVDERLVVRDDEGVVQAINPDAFTPILTRAIQQVSLLMGELSEKGGDAASLIANIRSEIATSPIAKVTEKIAGGKQILADFVAARVTAIRGYFDEIFAKKVHSDEICLKKSDGSEVCIDGDKLDTILEKNISNSATSNILLENSDTQNKEEASANASTGDSDSLSPNVSGEALNPETANPETLSETSVLPASEAAAGEETAPASEPALPDPSSNTP